MQKEKTTKSKPVRDYITCSLTAVAYCID